MQWVLPLKPTRFMIFLLGLVHSLAMVAMMLLTIPVWGKSVAIMAVAVHAVWQICRYWRRSPLQKFGFNASGFWCETSGQQHWVTVLPSSVITRWFISLHLKSTDTDTTQRFYVFLPIWHYAPVEYRALARQMLLHR